MLKSAFTVFQRQSDVSAFRGIADGIVEQNGECLGDAFRVAETARRYIFGQFER